MPCVQAGIPQGWYCDADPFGLKSLIQECVSGHLGVYLHQGWNLGLPDGLRAMQPDLGCDGQHLGCHFI